MERIQQNARVLTEEELKELELKEKELKEKLLVSFLPYDRGYLWLLRTQSAFYVSYYFKQLL